MISKKTKHVIEILEKSGFADDVCRNKGKDYKLRYRNMKKYYFSSKHRNLSPKNPPEYYRFLEDYVRTVLEILGSYKGKITRASQYFYMDKRAVEEFCSGMEIARSLLEKLK